MNMNLEYFKKILKPWKIFPCMPIYWLWLLCRIQMIQCFESVPIRMQIRWSLWRLDNMYVMKVNKLADMVVKMPNKDFTNGTLSGKKRQQ